MRLLLVEDDAAIGEVVHGALELAAYSVDWVCDGVSALSAVLEVPYDLVILDLGLPGQEGLEVLCVIRERSDPMPVVVMAAPDRMEERLPGLACDADEVLLKPFAMTDLMARVRSVLRRRCVDAAPRLGNGVVSLDPATRQASAGCGAPIRLAGREFALLHALLVRPGVVRSQSALEDRIYAWGEEVVGSAVEFRIHLLRCMLGSDVIRNVRGVGWMVDVDTRGRPLLNG